MEDGLLIYFACHCFIIMARQKKNSSHRLCRLFGLYQSAGTRSEIDTLPLCLAGQGTVVSYSRLAWPTGNPAEIRVDRERPLATSWRLRGPRDPNFIQNWKLRKRWGVRDAGTINKAESILLKLVIEAVWIDEDQNQMSAPVSSPNP